MELSALLKEFIAGNGNWISLILAFAILPSIYMRSAFDMQKEYVDIAKTVASNPNLSRSHKVRLVERSEEALQAFQLEWGMVCAIAVLVLANFSTSFLVDLSVFAKNATASTGSSSTLPSISPAQVKSFLSIYSIATVLSIFFQISWTRLVAIQRLRRIYLELGPTDQRARVSGVAPRGPQR
jgi:hypothetical protein